MAVDAPEDAVEDEFAADTAASTAVATLAAIPFTALCAAVAADDAVIAEFDADVSDPAAAIAFVTDVAALFAEFVA